MIQNKTGIVYKIVGAPYESAPLLIFLFLFYFIVMQSFYEF